MPLRLAFPFLLLTLPGLLRRDRELHDWRADGQKLGFGMVADKANDRKLIEVHDKFSFFLAVLCLGTQTQVAAVPQPSDSFLQGDPKNLFRSDQRGRERYRPRLLGVTYESRRSAERRAQGFARSGAEHIRSGRRKRIGPGTFI